MNSKKYFIADTHFGHSNIIKYENRPFADIYAMEEAIIENWNTVVNQNSEVFVLGDFSLYDKDKTLEICHRLNGKKTLVIGNHDMQSPKYYLECGFDNVSMYPIIIDKFWILSHEPLYVNENMPYANIFGHVHSNKMYADYCAQSFCVSVERINYTPINFSKIKKLVGVKS